jgi:hypothetical protein
MAAGLLLTATNVLILLLLGIWLAQAEKVRQCTCDELEAVRY